MKNKIIETLEKPRIILPIMFGIALVAGFFVYKFVGQSPKITVDFKDDGSLLNDGTLLQNLKDGEEVSLAFAKSGRVSNVAVKAGDFVHKGQMLASLDSIDAQGAVNQATGALEVAKANYEKILNGATGNDIDVLKAAVSKAQVNLEKTKSTQDTLVKNAYRNLLNSTPEALPVGTTSEYVAPIISGNYNKGLEGNIIISVYYTGSGSKFSVSGIENGSGNVTSTTPQPIGDSGLYIKWPNNLQMSVTDWNIEIPNKKASNYLANLNAYQSALNNQSQLISLATSDLEQVQTTLNSKQASARPEDVAIAKAQIETATGALQIAQGAFNNNFIYAPADGTITVVNVSSGEISMMNQKAIGMIVKLTSKQQ